MAPTKGPPVSPTLSHNFATASDGTKLSYYTVGTGPSLLILHGAVSYALTHKELALALSPHYTVHLASRRGRGHSGPYPSTLQEPFLPESLPTETAPVQGDSTRAYSPAFTAAVLSIETSDLHTLLTATKAQYLIAVSSGALVTLQYIFSTAANTVQSTPALKKIILFEPPLFVKTDYPTTPSLTQYEAERTAGDDVAAMVTAMQIVQLGPGWVPRWLMRWAVGHMFRAEEKKEATRLAGKPKVGASDGGEGEGKGEAEKGSGEGNVGMKGLGALLRFDFAVAEGMVGSEERFQQRISAVDEGGEEREVGEGQIDDGQW